MLKKIISKKGFSLIEVLVVIGVMAIVGFIMTDILSRTLRGGNKTQLINTIKQNGDNSLNLIDKTIQFADQVVCAASLNGSTSATSGDTIVVVKNGVYTRFRFFPQTTPNPTSNGYIEEDTFALNDPNQATSVLCTQNQNSAQVNTTSQVITDQNTVTGVSVQPGSAFTWTQNPGSKDLVTINFSLAPGVNIGTGSENQVGGNINFSTSVGLR